MITTYREMLHMKFIKFFLLNIFFISLLSANTPQTEQNTSKTIPLPNIKKDWKGTTKYIGPGNGGAMFGLAFHPTDLNKILFGGDMGAFYSTKDAGKSWKVVKGTSRNQPATGGVWDIQYDPKNPKNVWLCGNSVYKSTDGGETWQYLNVANRSLTLSSLAIDPNNSEIVYVTEGYASRIEINWVRGNTWKTTNGGKSWTKLSRAGGSYEKDTLKYRNYSKIIIDPNSSLLKDKGHSTLYLAGRGGLFKSINAGKSWFKLYFSDTRRVSGITLVDRNNTSTLFISIIPTDDTTSGGVYKSVDNGLTWKSANKGLEQIVQNLKKVNKHSNSSSLFSLILAHGQSTSKRLYVGSWQGIARSDDMGKNWILVTPREGTFIKDSQGKYIYVLRNRKHFKKSLVGGIDEFNNMVVSSSNDNIISFTDNQDAYFSIDAGKTWESRSFDYTNIFNPNSSLLTKLPNRYTHKIKSRGIHNVVSKQIQIDPFDSKIYYAAYMDLGLQISRDAGKSWEHPSNGTPSRGHAWSLAVDKQEEGIVYLSLGYGKLYISHNKGKDWSQIFNTPLVGKINDIKIDPSSHEILYIATEKNGVYKSQNQGKSWEHLSHTFNKKAKQTFSLAINQLTLYVATNDGLYLYRKIEKKWEKIVTTHFEKVRKILPSHKDSSTFYVIAHLPKQNYYWGESHLFKTKDKGKTFKDITPKYAKYIGAIAINTKNENYLYTCSRLFNASKKEEYMSLSISKDAGNNWEMIEDGTSFSRCNNMLIDPHNSKHFFISTSFSIIEGEDLEAP
jgi:photosystem II stability/assembly factor-like uncharacterized protein